MTRSVGRGLTGFLSEAGPDLIMAFTVMARVEQRPARQCPVCHRKWPFDWEYCQHCAVWIGRTEAMEWLTRLVPVADASVPRLGWDDWWPSLPGRSEAVVLACEVRCGTEWPSSEELRQGRELLRGSTTAIAAHGGTAHVVPGAGVLGCWTNGEDHTDWAARAAATIVWAGASGDRITPRHPGGVSLGIGMAAPSGRETFLAHLAPVAFRLASLARPDTVLVSHGVYALTREWFDYRGVSPVVPRSEPLPEPVFELLGAKPERSGSQHVGPEWVPLVGRRGLLHALDECHRTVVGGRGVVLHLIGEPGVGKSKLLREWMAGLEQKGQLAGWLRLETHGVPYGGYPLRAWDRLVASLDRRAGEDPGVSSIESPAAEAVVRQLLATGRPAVIVVDDLHWVDAPSRQALAALITGLAGVPALVILAYRPSFSIVGPKEPAWTPRYLHLRGLGHEAMRRLLEKLASREAIELPRACRDEIVSRARGNPLYAEEAVAHLAETSRRGGAPPVRLPSSLPELLIQRIHWTLERDLPGLEQRSHAGIFSLGLERDATLRQLDTLEERLAAWLDRFDVIEGEAPTLIQQFLQGLGAIDGRLALLSLFLGRQRPHCHRLAQALARLGGRSALPAHPGPVQSKPACSLPESR